MCGVACRSAERLKTATDIAALPLQMRGFGHVKLANVERYHAALADVRAG